MTSKTTRRAVLAGAAALPALTIIPATALPAIGGTDPIFAAIERCRVAEAAGLIEPVQPGTKDIRPAREALARTSPTTPAGLVALTGFLREQTAAFGEFYFDTTSDEPAAFASSLDHAVRGMAGLKPWDGIADAQPVDPIFAAIDAHKRARAAMIAAGKESSRRGEQLKKEGVPFREIVKICDSISDAAADADTATRDAILSCEPTTSAGIAALLAYVAEIEGDYPDGDTLLTVVTTASRAAKRLAA